MEVKIYSLADIRREFLSLSLASRREILAWPRAQRDTEETDRLRQIMGKNGGEG